MEEEKKAEMKNTIVLIKVRSASPGANPIVKRIENNFKGNCEESYHSTQTDTEKIMELKIEPERDLKDRPVVFIVYGTSGEGSTTKMYVGKISSIERKNNRYYLNYQITNKIESPLVVKNYMRVSTLDIENDFEKDSYISIEDSEPLLQQISYAINTPKNRINRDPEYRNLEKEVGLSTLAQRNEYCRRFYNVKEPSEVRGEFVRDYDRILYSKAFRRMMDKAQIFTSSKGDHYRTRMTHTLCVVQIARSIALRIGANVDLSEAIALGHDLGHTPFGHQGERTLKNLSESHGAGGFKHNFQSIKVATSLEEAYVECQGLDLSVQTLEGMWKHTKYRKKGELICDLKDYLPEDIATPEMMEMLHPNEEYCSTLEGQIVGMADEIAQRSHDLDDALSAGLITIETFKNYLTLKKVEKLRIEIENLQDSITENKRNGRVYASEKELLASGISARVIDFFVDDVVALYEEKYKNGEAERIELEEYFSEYHCLNRQVISFSPDGKKLNDYLDIIVKKQVINSPEVAEFDDKAQRVVTALFDFYYNNPRILHEGTLQRIFIEMRKRSENVIHFQDGDIDLVNEEWKRIKAPAEAAKSIIREKYPDYNVSDYKCLEDFYTSLGEEERERIRGDVEECMDEYRMKNRILVRAICDFIAGMTDTYALEQFRNLAC